MLAAHRLMNWVVKAVKVSLVLEETVDHFSWCL